MAIQGLRTTLNFVTDQRPKNWREGVLLLYPNGKAPLTALTNAMKSKATDDPEFNWWTKLRNSQRMALSASINTAVTTIPVTSGALNLKDGHLIRVEQSGEILLVTGDPASDTSFTAQRAYSGSTAAAVTYNGAGVNPNMHVIGSAYEEGSLAPTGISRDPSKLNNYTQIFRNTLEMTRTASKTRLRTGDAAAEAKREAYEDHQTEIEKALIFGKPLETTRNGKPLRTTGGIIHNIDSGNIVDQAGVALPMNTLEGWLERVFRFGSSEKICFCGNLFLLGINQAIRKNSTYNIQNGLKEYGMNVSRLICPFGELVMKTHPLFNEITGGTTGGTAYYGYNSWGLIVDQAELVYRYMAGDDMRYEKDLQSNGQDGMKSGYITECGLEIHHPTTHFLIKGVASGAADA